MNSENTESSQLLFEFGNYNQFKLDSFLPGKNSSLLNLVYKISKNESQHCLYLWGKKTTGKTHLLQAACTAANNKGLSVSYIPLNQFNELSPEILHDLGMLDLVCIDDLDKICGEIEWQQSLTWLYNELRDNNHSLILGASESPKDIKLEVSDLKSRLVWDQVFQIIPPDDELKIRILKNRAEESGFDLTDEVIEFLMRRVNRDLASLIEILEKIDRASLVAKRKITVPFVRELIN